MTSAAEAPVSVAPAVTVEPAARVQRAASVEPAVPVEPAVTVEPAAVTVEPAALAALAERVPQVLAEPAVAMAEVHNEPHSDLVCMRIRPIRL